MKKVIITLALGFLVTGLWAQNDEGAKIVTVSQAIQNNGFTIQVGLPYLGNTISSNRVTNPLDVRFPWSILYLYQTFAEESFDVSKGYFGDKIRINWDLRANFDLISSIKIYKREYNGTSNSNLYEFVGSVNPSETVYEDKYVEGGVLYEYKIVAEGISDIESLYTTYITGIGYRNPTAVVTGNISYEGGNPVKDVIIKATSDGSGINTGSSLLVPEFGSIKIEELSTSVSDAVTFQAWVKPENPYSDDTGTAIKLFQLSNLDINTIDVSVNLRATSKILSINIGGSEYRLHNYFPSGKLNTKGDDVMVPVTDFNDTFVHFSVIMSDGNIPLLYINGREITENYKTAVNEKLIDFDPLFLPPYFDVTIPTQTNTLKLGGNDTQWDDVYVGGGISAFIDEIRIWKAILEPQIIRTDYTRYISGNDSRLVTYLSANEKVGSYAYDISRNGFEYNKNHGELWNFSTATADKVLWDSGTGNFPTTDQLGILGVSDENGNYEITSIPYSGTGESFNITPLYGQHQFEPGQQLVFLGEGSEVVNKVDFTDISSFNFKGKVLFDTRGVFKSFVEVNSIDGTLNFSGLTDGDQYVSASKVIGEGYNYYETLSDGKKDKGEYWYNDNATPSDTSDDYLERYAKVYSENVNVYIDNEIVLDENYIPVVSGPDGLFDIRVPIGNHSITVKKDGYSFKFNGRFPEASGDYKEFFEDSNEAVIFVDSTRVTVVGKVVGGSVEAAKVIGFGEEGLFQKQIQDTDGNAKTLTISSKNNIGVANLKFDYIPLGATESDVETEFNFSTNTESGEYRVSIMPLLYQINQFEGLIIKNNTTVSLLDDNGGTLNVLEVTQETIPEYENTDGSFDYGEPYHYEKSFTYRTTPVLRVENQTSDAIVQIGDERISTTGFAYPIYTQFGDYEIRLKSFERYINKDSGSDVEDVVPIIDGEFKPTNNLALESSESVERDSNDASIIIYKFRGGLPAITSPFTKTIDIRYRINGIDYEAENYIKKGIILGGESDGSQTFITAAPDVPDIILRDPPGSNSSASIESGESITFTTESDFKVSGGISERLKLLFGVEMSAGGGLAGPVIKTENVNNFSAGISLSSSSKTGESLTKTYSFTQAISTSDSPEYVGAEGDLYIGQSKNYFYGSYDNVQSSTEIIGTSDSYKLTNSANKSIFISKQKAMYFREEPSETFFIFSQKHILETLIPELELIVSNLINGIISEDDDGVVDLPYYEQQINLWRSTIRENEKSKYNVLNNRSVLKGEVSTRIGLYIGELESAIDNADLGAGGEGYEDRLKRKLNDSERIQTLIDENFDENISFDAGVGEFTKSVETIIVNTKSTEFNLTIKEDLAFDLGFKFNSVGFVFSTAGFVEEDINASLTEEQTSTTNISYTLKDNDPANLLSVDVVNLFDGNGPVFSTIGGRTSCPYEGPELSYFYNNADYDEGATIIPVLPIDKREQLSYATQKAEEPLISVEIKDVSNIPESKNAEFTLILENRADYNSDAASFNYFELIVDNTTNPHNAIINLAQNGRVVYVPYGEPVEYTLTLGKSVSDVYDYENIRIVLQSRCDPVNVFDDVFLSAHFVPSCSEVELNAPLNNWVYNNKIAYNVDGTINPLKIEMASFDTGFNSFQKIDLEYRLATSSTWTRLQTYYTTEAFYDEAVLANESDIALISDTKLNYSLDIVGRRLQDGFYELRARSSCTNDTEYISEIITGRVDLTDPQRFGTPLPIDGILGIGEDLKVTFNEPIFYNSAISNIEIKGQTNQLPINHSVSVHFEGADNTAVINNPKITTGDLTLEFWMNNSTLNTPATIIEQDEGGIKIALDNGEISFTIAGTTASGGIFNDGLFHHYTFTHKNSTGEISIYQDDTEIAGSTGNSNVNFTNNNALILGGNSFIGNIHNLRLWNKTIGLETAYANMYDKLVGNEANLVGYWPMDEGRGTIAKDLARFKHMELNADWDIKPKGNSYEFDNGEYLTLNDVGFVQLTNEMDATISFWMKTASGHTATLFSNGKGDGSDIVQSNGLANKWAINITNSGMLTLESEGNSYVLTNQSIADNNWHHVTLLYNRIGSLRSYIDAEPVASHPIANIGGFSGNTIWIGARGTKDLGGNETIDQTFTGKIDEFRLWNTLRNSEQISRDRFNEVSAESIGLQLYARMNAPDPLTGNGPRYFHADVNETVTASLAQLVGTVNYSDDVPPIKPERELIKFEVNHVINGDEMILEPVVTDWAILEGQILDITVHRMFDSANNRQQSPITWTAYVKRNEVSWFAEGYNEIVDIVKNIGEEKSFEITLLNKGGKGQPYNITNIPSWLSLSSTSGTIAPDSKIIVTATIDTELTAGEYTEILYLQTNFGYDEKLQIDLRVIAEEPEWAVNPNDFEYSMNIVGRIKVDGVFSTDTFDKVGAFYNGEVRGEAKVIYVDNFQEYYVYLTVYSNDVYGENIEFNLWDASQGKILVASIDANPTTVFKENEVIGTLTNPVIFENSDVLIQEIELNKGWSWISLNVTDSNFSNLNTLTQSIVLETDDRILSHSPSQLETYYNNVSVPENSTWSGSISANGGLSVSNMYKVNFANDQTLEIKGILIDISTWSFPIKINWNWLPYPLLKNQPTNEALAYFDAVDGDVIKSQSLFAIFDPINGWNGTLNYLVSGDGYMIKSSKDQTFTYPSYLSKYSNNNASETNNNHITKATSEFNTYPDNMNAVVLLPEGYDELFVYDTNGTLKGVAHNQMVNNKALSFITIYGDIPETLVFHIGNGYTKKSTTKIFSFNSNTILGTVAKPVILENILDAINVFPNPFKDEFVIQAYATEKQVAIIQVFNMIGQLVFEKNMNVEKGINRLHISPEIATGPYLLHVKMDEKTVINKLLKN